MTKRNPADVRAKIAELLAEQQAPGTPLTRLTALYGMEMALRWASGEEVEVDDLAKPIPMRWRRQEDGAYLSSAGYRIHQQAPHNWYTERPESEPMPGWNTHTTLDIAKKQCENDWRERLRNTTEL